MNHVIALSLCALVLAACSDGPSAEQKKLADIAKQAPPSAAASGLGSGEHLSLQDIAKQAPPSKSIK